MERRTLLAAGGAAVLMTGCVVQRAAPTATSSTPVAPETKAGTAPAPLAKVADIPAGGGVILKEQSLVLTKDATGKICAFSAICTHQGCVVTGVGGGTIDCACHGSKFDATTGERVAGPAKDPLPAVAFQQRDGAIFQGA